MNKLLFVVSRPPYQGTHNLELIEAAMVGAVFDLEVSVLFRDEGIWALLDGQDAGALQQRTLSKVLSALPAYDVERLFVCSESMQRMHLQTDQFCVPVTLMSLQAQADLMAQQHAVLGAQP